MPPKPPVTVVLARFDDLLARGLRELLESDPGLTILATDVEHGRIPVVLRAHQPDVAVLDADAFAKLADVRELRAQNPAVSLVLLSRESPTEETVQLLAFGASACLGVETQSRDVLNAIHLASRGLQVIPQTSASESGRASAAGHLLTQREAEVLPLLQQGRSNAQIAVALQMGIETVRTHARHIYGKLGVSSRRELAAPRASAPAPHPAPTALRGASAPRAVHALRRRSSAAPSPGRRGHGSRYR
jgi:two-component system nitrate/nitrite response regulator NarL